MTILAMTDADRARLGWVPPWGSWHIAAIQAWVWRSWRDRRFWRRTLRKREREARRGSARP